MNKFVTCPLDGQKMMPTAAARHVGTVHPHLTADEQVALTRFLGGLE